MYRYLVLLDRYRFARGHDRDAVASLLNTMGFSLALALEGGQLFVPAATPILPLPGGGVLVGHLFTRDGEEVRTPSALPQVASGQELAARLLENYWGDYLLLQPPDQANDALHVMRDPSGGVDCVYSLSDGFITSDISLAAHAGLFSRDVDWDFIRWYLLYPHLKNGRTALVGLRELLPGCRLAIRDNHSTLDVAWTPWRFVEPERRLRDRDQAAAALRHAVTVAVRCWAGIDRSVLLELSGGLDSSIVAACLQHSPAHVICCNLVTPVPGADERRYALKMTSVLEAELHVRELGFEDIRIDAPPPANAVAPSTWFLQHASNVLKEQIAQESGTHGFVSGGGGDTVFCYSRTAAPAADALAERGLLAGLSAMHDLAELHQCTVWKAAHLTFRKAYARPARARTADRTFVAATVAEVKMDAHPWFSAPDDALPGDRERIFDLAGTQVFRDGLARAATSPLRMPLLSQPVVEACLAAPSWMWITGGRNRALARDAFADALPADILHRRSKGTFMSYSGAVYRRNRQRICDFLLNGRLEAHGLLATDALRRFLDGDASTPDGRFMRIFELCAIENWIRHQA